MEVASESVEAVGFSFLTSEEVLKHSFVKITNPILLDSIGRPVPGGLYDPALGPLDEKAPCKSCGQPSKICPGHCGHIDLVSPTYNPLLFNILHKILQKTCFFCYKFRANRIEVETCTSQLELIMKGDIVGAKMLDPDNPNESTCEKNADDFQYHSAEELQQKWTSLQFTEAMDVINKFLRAKMKKCGNCKRKNPQISKPTFGWFYMNQMRDQQARENVIRGSTLDDAFSLNESDGAERDTTSPASGVTEVSDIIGPNIGEELSLQFLKQKSFSGTLLPSEVKDIIKLLWENEVRLCSLISDIQGQGLGDRAGHTMFFLETILVPPIKFRPPTKGGDSVMEHPQTVSLTKVLQSNISLGNAHVNNLDRTKIVGRWRDLQQSINMLFDNKTASGQRVVAPGTIQLLEKKEGMFRQKMMGKRVNFACRSVISPDPYLAVNEIGIPPYFALRLTYPERVTPSNVVQLRDAVRNGPDLHPGATHYADKVSIVRLPPNEKKRNAISKTLSSSKGVVMRHGKICDYETEGKIVYRHLKDGDVVLVNRQPTLHKPSIMAHIVRVLKGEKTVRMHYANCSTYNADFDGDEMNVHFPQDEISRAEAYHIVNANNQYVKPTSGEPIRALIQDHIVSAALLTKKDTFLSHDEFNQLLYSSGVSSTGLGSFCGKPGQQVFISNSEDEIFSLPPAIWKPEPLWTGKQVISALLYYITRGCPPFSVEKSAKIPRDFFKNKDGEQNHSSQGILTKSEEADEDNVLIYKNDLVRGVVDKAQFGDYGMVHTVQELYGSDIAGNLLSALSRLFTAFLQMHGFTCGIDDLLLMERKDCERKKQLEKCEEIGENVHREFVEVMEHEEIDPITLQMNIEKRIRNSGEAALTYLDRKMISGLNSRTSSGFFKELLVEGILKPTGKNCISLMTTSGAKGSSVNFQQISSYLGQQELEGKRVPRMVSGKTLPCFPPWDSSPRAGGFIIDRFLTGLHPQEYYFHCMAGREGLVDTAVKTSRSGYLQRCLIKNLECLKICYDNTVRDADGSIIQFQYGEDGVDVHRTSFITKFEAFATNQEMIYNGCRRQLDKSSPYVQKLPFALEEKAEKFMHDFSSKQRIPLIKKRDFLKLIEHKYLSSLAQPGEPVGVLAAQSVGEPSTQMTLNTFHLAGRGEMNVTLGIPRLQEILMTASNDIKTPVMTCPLQEGRSMDDATRLADKLKKITIADIIESMKVSVVPVAVDNHKIVRIYKLEMKLYKPKHYPKYTNISDADWKRTLEFKFVRKLEDAIQKHVELLSNICGIKNFIPNKQSKFSSVEDDVSTDRSEPEVRDASDDEGNEDTEEGEDLGLDAQKRKQQDSDEVDYDEDSEVELTTSELNDGELPGAFEREVDRAESETNSSEDDVNEVLDPDDVESPSAFTKASESIDGENKRKSIEEKKPEAELEKKENDRRILVKSQGMDFVIHFQFTTEPHFLLAQLAQRTAKMVCIQSFGKVDECRAVTSKENQIIYYGKDPRSRDDIPSSVKEKVPALQTTGVDFVTFWQLQNVLDVRYIYSNNIHAVLNTYGVEAARETIIREIMIVFKSYGISVNIRHLTLIADFMTHSGGYRPMNRMGGIAESISPFCKMSFETAAKFIVEAAFHAEVDNLETPSARICLGLPVKMGTGCFDLMQKVEI